MKQTRVNLVQITQNAAGFDTTVTTEDGFTESIEGLYNLESSLAYSRMHIGQQNSIYWLKAYAIYRKERGL